jgi:hypothetical protein
MDEDRVKYENAEFDPASMDFRIWVSLHIANGEIVFVEISGDAVPLHETDYFDTIEGNDLRSFDRISFWGLEDYKGVWRNVRWTAISREDIKLSHSVK